MAAANGCLVDALTIFPMHAGACSDEDMDKWVRKGCRSRRDTYTVPLTQAQAPPAAGAEPASSDFDTDMDIGAAAGSEEERCSRLDFTVGVRDLFTKVPAVGRERSLCDRDTPRPDYFERSLDWANAGEIATSWEIDVFTYPLLEQKVVARPEVLADCVHPWVLRAL